MHFFVFVCIVHATSNEMNVFVSWEMVNQWSGSTFWCTNKQHIWKTMIVGCIKCLAARCHKRLFCNLNGWSQIFKRLNSMHWNQINIHWDQKTETNEKTYSCLRNRIPVIVFNKHLARYYSKDLWWQTGRLADRAFFNNQWLFKIVPQTSSGSGIFRSGSRIPDPSPTNLDQVHPWFSPFMMDEWRNDERPQIKAKYCLARREVRSGQAFYDRQKAGKIWNETETITQKQSKKTLAIKFLF